MGDDPDIIWMTYDEAARALRIKPDSVRRRATSRKWPKRLGNDKLARVGIPRDIIPETTPDITPDKSDDAKSIQLELQKALAKINILEGDLKAKQASISRLENHLKDTKSDRDSWREQATEMTRLQAELMEQSRSSKKQRSAFLKRLWNR